MPSPVLFDCADLEKSWPILTHVDQSNNNKKAVVDIA
jgi:hypothetical protein